MSNQNTRREFLISTGKHAVYLSTLSLLNELNCSQSKNRGSNHPNVLLIMCDQLNASVLGCYGGPVPTPHIDQLAKEGALFTQATCPFPVCSPSRASMITGLYPHTHGICHNVDKDCEGIHPDDITTEKILFEGGYDTFHSGKWHLHDEELPYYHHYYRDQYNLEIQSVLEEAKKRPPEKKMQFYDMTLPVETTPELKKVVSKLGDRWKNEIYADFIMKMGRLEMKPEQTFDVRYADETIKHMQSVTSNSFMLTCSFIWPHDPNVVPSPYYEMFSPDKVQIPENLNFREQRFEKDWSRKAVDGVGEPGLREFLRIYYATVRLVDDQVGRILSALEATGKSSNTIIIFTADHGDMAGGHGMIWKSTSGFYDEIVRIPLIIRFPGQIQPQKTDSAAGLTDIMPTILELSGFTIPEKVQGHSLAPYLKGERNHSEAPVYSFCERIPRNPNFTRGVIPGTQGNFMIRGAGWKYIRYANGEEYMYNLRTDPGETKNIVNEPSVQNQKNEMRKELDNWLKNTGYPVHS